MGKSYKRPALGGVIYFAGAFCIGTYFTFAAVQGDYGLFRRIQVEADLAVLTTERDALAAQMSDLQNKTRRLSDQYLDIDLLDERARKVLGLVRPDEIVIR